MGINRKEFLRLSGLGTAAILGNTLAKTELEARQSPDLIIPKSITRNSTLGLIAPASPVYDPRDFEEMLINLKNLGFTLKLGKHVKDRRGFLAGNDQDRAEDLMAMFKDDTVDAVMCVRGGWGCARILDYIDFEVLRQYPKPLIGYSDITALHMSIQNETGLVTYHGPVGTSDWNDFTIKSFDDTLINGNPQEYSIPEEDLADAYTIQSGKARGRILGGNLTVLTAIIGSGYLPDFSGSILFLEEVEEAVYRVDRMLTQLKLAGILDQINGFIFGRCTKCSAGPEGLPLNQIFDDHIKPLGIPAYYGAMISHEDKNVTIPVGLEAEMDAGALSFRILNKTVR